MTDKEKKAKEALTNLLKTALSTNFMMEAVAIALSLFDEVERLREGKMGREELFKVIVRHTIEKGWYPSSDNKCMDLADAILKG